VHRTLGRLSSRSVEAARTVAEELADELGRLD
jgi:hypothetical protein